MSASQTSSSSTTGANSNTGSSTGLTGSQAKKNNETTLTHLTKRFVKLLNTNSDRVVNLNEASSRLSVAKRRIYDITNVLEGIGLLQKTSKNVTRWIDCPRDSPYAASANPQANHQHQQQQHLASSNLSSTSSAPTTPTILTNSSSLDQLCESSINSNSCSSNHNLTYTSTTTTTTRHHNNNNNNHLQHHNHHHQPQPTLNNAKPPLIADPELLALLKTYQSLEEGVQDLEANIRQQLGAEGAYVTYHDIKSFFNDQIVIAVKAPPETRLEVNESLQIWMKSENGEIEVYLCPQYANTNNQISNQNNNACANNPNLPNHQIQQQQQQQPPLPPTHQHHHVYHHPANNNSPHLQQSHIANTQPPDQTTTPTITNNNTANLILQQQQQQPSYTTAISSDEGRGKSVATTDGQYYDPTSGGVSHEDHYYNNDPTLSSALSGNMSEDDDPFKPLVPFEAREETQYNFTLGDDYSITELFPEDNLGLY